MYVQIKTCIEFALVCEHKDLAFLFWDIFCGACSQWGELASIMRKGRIFPNDQCKFPSLTACSTKDVPFQSKSSHVKIRCFIFLGKVQFRVCATNVQQCSFKFVPWHTDNDNYMLFLDLNKSLTKMVSLYSASACNVRI